MRRFSRFANFSYIRTDLLEEHLEEAEFLWGQRDNALYSGDYDLADLAKLEKRLNAHLDGLSIGGARTIQLLEPELEGDDVYRIAAAAAGLLSLESEPANSLIFDSAAETSNETQVGFVMALCFRPLTADVKAILQTWLNAESANQLAIAWDVLSFWRDACAADISVCVQHENPLVRQAAALAIGRLGRSEWLPFLAELQTDDDEEVRQMACMSAAQTGDQKLLEILRERCQSPEKVNPWEIHLLAILGDLSDVELLTGFLADAATAESGAAALAALGYTQAVPALLNAMSQPLSAAAAGAAFQRIVGCDLPILPPVEQTAEEEDAGFADMRPLPDRPKCQDLWSELQNTLPADQRLRAGEILTDDRWLAEPNQGDLLSRREEIFRLRHKQPGALPALELDAPSTIQLALKQEA